MAREGREERRGEGIRLTPAPGQKDPREEAEEGYGSWHQVIREYMTDVQKPLEALAFVGEMLGKFKCPFTDFTAKMDAMEREETAGNTPKTTRSTDLLPVNIEKVKEFLRGRDDRIATWVVKVVEILNYHALGMKPKLAWSKLTPAQELMITRFVEVAKRFVHHGGSVRPIESGSLELASAKFDYAGEPVQYMQELEASKVIPCWPRVGEAAVQDATDFVSPMVRDWLEDPSSCLLPVGQWPDVPPLSRVRATDEEWEKIVTAGYERGMMRMVKTEDVFRDTAGRPIVNGAGGVKKLKKIGGEERELQRFISILVPSNSYQKNMPGDDEHLPYLGQMAMLEIDVDEDVLIDSEDLTSCFNLFRVPPKWSSYFAFAKKVSARVFGGDPGEMVYVGMSVVPMGWINSVSLMQTVVRTLVFSRSKIPEDSEISKLKWFPKDDSVSVVYLDSYDELRRINKGCREVLSGQISHRHQRFVNTCNELGLPLNEGKRLVGAVFGSLQGGGFDGSAGIFEASPDKKHGLLTLALAIMATGRATEFEIRHFVGKLIFIMAFRRPTMSFLEAIFGDMRKAQDTRGKITLSRGGMEELMIAAVMVPLMAMNLRAQLDKEVTITDASPTGGGGAVSSKFKDAPDRLHHDGKRCYHCEKTFDELGKFSCPAGCGVILCCLVCIWEHRAKHCPRRDYTLPRFGERFAGPRAPLTHEVARVGGFDVQEPYDLKTGDDFFSDEGRKKLEELENDELLAAEHWGPECRLFSKARGKPVKLPDGQVIDGPQPVRDANHVMGFPWLSADMKVQLRRSNKMALRALKRAEANNGTQCITTVEHPWGSWLWYFSLVDKLTDGSYRFAEGSACCFGGKRVKWYALLGNSREVHREVHRPNCPGHEGLVSYDVRRRSDGSLQFATEEESEYKKEWCEAYARGLRREAEFRGWLVHAETLGREAILTRQLLQSTARLRAEELATLVAREIAALELNMKPGLEASHLKEMIRKTSIRGSDIRMHLRDQVNEIPYPAYRWWWKEVLSYAWNSERHINEGEVGAFNIMLRRRAKEARCHEMRYLAIVDSMVSRGAIGKGRSPSKPINKLLKQTAAVAIASDQYPLLTWTISQWNFADLASRRKTTKE